MKFIAVMIATTLVACGDNQASGVDAGTDVDAAVRQPCWPDGIRIHEGSATLGTGRGDFEMMPDVLPLEYGTQDGYNLVANVRMNGFPPGNPQNILDPSNPRTRIRAYFADTNIPLNFYSHCPFRNAYVPSDEGDFQLVEGVPIIFETCWRSEHLFGKRIRIELEVLDDRGRYAFDVKTVTAAPPTTFYPIEQGTPGCKHAPVPGPLAQEP